jgi:hypothetical protein
LFFSFSLPSYLSIMNTSDTDRDAYKRGRPIVTPLESGRDGAIIVGGAAAIFSIAALVICAPPIGLATAVVGVAAIAALGAAAGFAAFFVSTLPIYAGELLDQRARRRSNAKKPLAGQHL